MFFCIFVSFSFIWINFEIKSSLHPHNMHFKPKQILFPLFTTPRTISQKSTCGCGSNMSVIAQLRGAKNTTKFTLFTVFSLLIDEDENTCPLYKYKTAIAQPRKNKTFLQIDSILNVLIHLWAFTDSISKKAVKTNILLCKLVLIYKKSSNTMILKKINKK